SAAVTYALAVLAPSAAQAAAVLNASHTTTAESAVHAAAADADVAAALPEVATSAADLAAALPQAGDVAASAPQAADVAAADVQVLPSVPGTDWLVAASATTLWSASDASATALRNVDRFAPLQRVDGPQLGRIQVSVYSSDFSRLLDTGWIEVSATGPALSPQ